MINTYFLRKSILKSLFAVVCSFFAAGMQVHANQVRVNGINMYYELHGKGEPIVLIAGFACDHTFWTGVLAELATTHQILIFDNRGIGRTESPNPPYSIDMMADDVMSLIKVLGLKRPTIVGQSMGSAMTQSISKRYAKEINKIVLINTFYKLNKGPQITFDLLGEMMAMKLGAKYQVQALAPWAFSNEFLLQPNQLENLIKQAENNPYPQTVAGYQGQLQALKKFDSLNWLNQIASPTLIIAGEQDILAPSAEAQEIVKRIGHHAQLAMVPGGHATPIEQPRRTAQLILKFVSEN